MDINIIQDIIKMYNEDKLSTHVIGKRVGLTASKVKYALQRNGVKLRSKSEAQANAIESGVAEHPTRGKKLSESHKNKIGDTVSENYKSMSEEDKAAFSERCRQNWYKMSPEKRKEMQEKAHDALCEAARYGSKLEHFLSDYLRKSGLHVFFHKKGLIINDDMEVDIYVPNANLCIEIDGPTHHIPIFGEEELQKTIKADSIKNGLLLSNGYVVLRIKYVSKSVSPAMMRQIGKIIVDKVKEIDGKTLDISQKFIELEI